MSKFRWAFLCAVTSVFSLGHLACTQSQDSPPAGEAQHDDHDHGDGKSDHAEDNHAHPEFGPHKGDLIELGEEEYHAELIHGEKDKSVTIYLLDASATKPVSIPDEKVTINLKHDGKPEQFALKASAQEGDPEGQSSRFVSSDSHLAEALDEEGAEPRLQVTIAGNAYTGIIEHHHDHDHEGHDHKDGEHDDHDHDKK